MPNGRMSLVLAITLITGWMACPTAQATNPPHPPRFKLLNNKEAARRLPRETPPLPAWARILAHALPRTTAAMLKLDYVHRAQNPLDPVLRGKLRWIAADANHCTYSKRYAEADLRRAGLTEKDLKKLAGHHQDLPASERALLDFARKMSEAAYTVTDQEMDALLKRHGAAQVVAMVHTLAYANFQDRILLTLGVEVEPGGPLPPRDYPFAPRGQLTVALPERLPWKKVLEKKPSLSVPPADWPRIPLKELKKKLEQQRNREPRIPLPNWDAIRAQLPPEAQKRPPSRNLWTNVSMGYQPMLTQTWFDCMRAFRQEAKLDRVLAQTLFWLVNYSNQCFY